MSAEGLPPLEPLLEVHRRLAGAGIAHALGASGLLLALALERHVGDWDVNTEADHDVLGPLFADLEPVRFGSSGIHADSKLQLYGQRVEVIVRMAIVAEGRVVRIPTLPRGRWQGVPVGSPEVWAVSYALLGRSEKSERLFDWLGEHGARADDVARMLEEPLPRALADRLAALALRAAGAD
ncbi:MAG: hypothetical protein ABI960_08880 [Candidatus Eisenbacteria bacterium]